MMRGAYGRTSRVVAAASLVMMLLAKTPKAFVGPLTSQKKGGVLLQRSFSKLRMTTSEASKKKILVLGGTGFLGQAVCQRAIRDGYQVTSLSRRGLPSGDPESSAMSTIDYRKGDARKIEPVANILDEGGYVGVVHAIGLLFDQDSGLGSYNVFVSGSGSVLDEESTYDAITRQTAFNAIDATIEYSTNAQMQSPIPFCFTSAAEAGWPDMTPGGPQVEEYLAPKWLKRYLKAKREVEAKLLSSPLELIRPVIVRPSLIYSLDRPASYLPVGAFFVGNKLGLPFVDRPVTVQSLSSAIVRSVGRNSVRGVQRYAQIDELAG